MSGGCFGIYSLEDQGVCPEHLYAMDRAMAYWGPDGGGLITPGRVALGARILVTTPEAVFEQQPLNSAPHCLVARARLDNRGELCNRLGVKNSLDVPDSQLILLAYRKYGQACVQHLVGDWSFALWDADKDLFIVARDATGNTGLYYWLSNRELVFSNGIQGILAHPSFAKRINHLHLACILTAFYDPETENDSVYEGVRQLPPGYMIVVKGRHWQIQRWWHPENLPRLNYKSLNDCYEEFVALYDQVVLEHLRISHGSIAATLSGGLDSGSVVALAAPHLKMRNQVLDAFVHIPLYETNQINSHRIGNELPLAQATAAHVGNTRIKTLKSADKTVLWGMQRGLEVHGKPMHAASHNYWLYDVQEQAKAMGVRVLLTGQMGNATVSFTGNGNLWPDVRHGRLLAVLLSLVSERDGVASAFKHRLLKPLLWPALKYRKKLTISRGGTSVCQSFINPGLENALQLKDRMQAQGFDSTTLSYPYPKPAFINAFRLGLSGNQISGMAWMEAGAAHGLDIRDPTRDQRIVEFCWQAPDSAFWANGLKRGLIRQGMTAKLPSKVLYSRLKGLQSADILERFRSEAPELLSAIAPFSHSKIEEYIDLSRMTQMLKALTRDEPVDMAMIHPLGRAIQCALFLGHIDNQ